MNELPPDLHKYGNRIIKFSDKWIILDGIDRHGDPLPEDGLLCVLYINDHGWVQTLCSKQMYSDDKEYFWNTTRQRVAEHLNLLRKESKDE